MKSVKLRSSQPPLKMEINDLSKEDEVTKNQIRLRSKVQEELKKKKKAKLPSREMKVECTFYKILYKLSKIDSTNT